MNLAYGATFCGDCSAIYCLLHKVSIPFRMQFAKLRRVCAVSSATYCLIHKVSIPFRMPFSKLRRVCAVIGNYVAQLLTAPTNRIHAKTLTLLIIASFIDILLPGPPSPHHSLCIPIERTAKGNRYGNQWSIISSSNNSG